MLILVGVVILLLFTAPNYSVNTIVKRDTIFNVKTLVKYKNGDSIPYKILVTDSVKVHDTIRIINEYLQIKAYTDTIRIDSNSFYIQDTISQNKILGRGFTANVKEKTIYITSTIKPKVELLIGGDLRNYNDILGASIGVGLKVPNKGIILINYGTQGYSVGFYKKLF